MNLNYQDKKTVFSVTAEDETLQSLEERVHKLEHKLYPKAISLFTEGRLKIKGRKVHILGKPAARPAAEESASGEDTLSEADNPARG